MQVHEIDPEIERGPSSKKFENHCNNIQYSVTYISICLYQSFVCVIQGKSENDVKTKTFKFLSHYFFLCN